MSCTATGLSRPPGRGARVPAVLAMLAVTLAALTTLMVGATPPAAAAVPPARVTVDTIDPTVATPGSLLRVTGRVTNTGRQALRNVEVRLRLSDSRLNSRAELAAVADGRTTSRDGEAIASQAVPDLARGETGSFDVSREVDELSALTGFGVYALGIEVLASRNQGFGRVAIARTLLPWVPAQPDFQPTGFSWVWPLVSRPTRLADGSFAEDTLAQEMGPDGRLTRLTDAGARLDEGAAVTWAVDPELLHTAADMADGYEVRAADGSLVPGGGSALAARWLDQLRVATAGRPVLALPYADPDVTAIDRGGLAGDIARALAEGRAAVAQQLPAATVLDDTAWPTDGYANRSTLATLRRNAVRSVVLDGRAVPSEIDLSYTPSGRAAVGTGSGRLAALLADPGLADLLRTRGADPVLGAQRLLAETAMITSELPSTGTERTVVLMPPRRWDPSPAYLERVTAGGSEAPWMAPVSLTDLAASEPPEVDRRPLQYPATQRRLELPRTYVRALAGTHTSINVFAAILTDRTEYVPELDRAVLRLASSWWRGRESRTNRLARERAYLAELRGQVRVQPASFTFSSRRGTIPLTVANELDQEVVVVLRLEPQTQRLRLDPVEPLRIGPRSKVQVEVPATAVAAGTVVVDASLHTLGGTPYGQPVPLRITITEYGTVALYITLGAAVVLFVMAGVRVVGRLRGGGRGGTGPQQPYEQAPVEAGPAEPERETLS